MYAQALKEEYAAPSPYIPAAKSSTGSFRIDAKIGYLMGRYPSVVAYHALGRSLFSPDERDRIAIVNPYTGLVTISAANRSPSTLDIQAILGGSSRVGSTSLIPTSYGVIFVDNTYLMPPKTMEIHDTPSSAAPKALSTPHSTLLREILKAKLWSLRRLKPILGPSPQQIARIARGSTPSVDVGFRIDELHRFLTRLARLTDGNRTSMRRVLTTPRTRDGKDASYWLEARDFRRAYGAVMDAVSPPLDLAETENLGLKWYDEPSRPFNEPELAQ